VVDVHDERPVKFGHRPGWTVTRARTSGQWLTAERVLERDRLIGLTPIHSAPSP
jgi:hypothetical protein